jgi:hypothetical protein
VVTTSCLEEEEKKLFEISNFLDLTFKATSDYKETQNNFLSLSYKIFSLRNTFLDFKVSGFIV